MARLQALAPAEPHLMGPYGKFPTAASLTEGRFEIHGQATILKPPIDWLQDPCESRSWCYQLHSVMWLKPLFLAYVETDDRVALTVALDIVADWISAHSRPLLERL